MTALTLVSVIIPSYNSGRFICDAVDSVLAQSYANLEIIVVDDGSTDDTVSRLQTYENRILYHYQPNQGVSVARNTGLSLAQGELIVFLDADDFIMQDKLALQSAMFSRSRSLGIVHSGWRLVDVAGVPYQEVTPWHDAPNLNLETWLFWKPVYPAAMMFRRSWIDKVGGFDPTLSHAEDVDLVWRMALAGCKAKWLRQPTSFYRQHENNAIRADQQQAESILKVMDKFFALPLPRRIRRREAKIRYYTTLWYAWKNYRNPNMATYLSQALQYVDYPPALLLLEWQAQLDAWHPDAGRDAWEFLVRGAAVQEDPRLGDDTALPARKILEWGDNPQESDLPQDVQLELAQFAILTRPNLLAIEDVKELWYAVSPGKACHQLALYLIGFARAVVHRRWRIVLPFILPIVRDSLHPRAPSAWWDFLKVAFRQWGRTAGSS